MKQLDTFMDNTDFFLLADAARILGVMPHQIVYLFTTRQLPEPRRIGNRRVFTIFDLHRISEKLQVPISQEVLAKGEA